MLTLHVLRHASTEWNEQGMIQGRRDVPLSARGRADAASWRLPPGVPDDAEWVSSPLRRATETVELLAGRKPRTEAALVEMAWGEWEGARLDELRNRLGDVFRANEQRGLDFRPLGGESPREVLARVSDWLRLRAGQQRPTIAVTHKGVLRVLLVAATGWDMIGKPPIRLDPACLHAFELDAAGRLSIVEANLRLSARAQWP